METGIKVIETIPPISMPDWVSHAERWEENGRIYFKVSGDGYDTLSDAQEASASIAKRRIIEELYSNITAIETVNKQAITLNEQHSRENIEFANYASMIRSVIDNVTISGIIVNKMYIQHIAEKKTHGTEVYYRAYVLASISSRDYKAIGDNVFEQVGREKNIKVKNALKQLHQKWDSQFK